MIESTRKQVLIVEHEMVVATDLTNSLQKLGYDIAGQARTADQAISQAAQTQPDLVLMDLQLNGPTDGIAAASAIRERWDIPIVFITANTSAAAALDRAKASGPYGFLSRPFRPRELDATLSVALNQHKLSRALFAERSWLATMLRSLSDGVIATDANGFVRHINAAAEAITGWSATGALGLPIEAVYPLFTMDGLPVEHCLLRRALITRQPIGKQRFLVRIKGGAMRPVEDSASPIIEDGEVLGAVTIFLDISETIERERLEASQRRLLEEQVHLASEALGNTRQELQALSHHLMAAQEIERSRIARELHDDLGQRTAWLSLELASLQARAAPGLEPAFEALRQDVADLAEGLRDVSRRIHPSIIQDLGLPAALEALVDNLRSPDLIIDLKVETSSHLPLEVATALYRIAQEAIANAHRHAPGCPVFIRLWREAEGICLSVRDRGLGFSLADIRQKGGIGLLSMQERARLVRGVLLLSADPEHGTTVLARVPL